MNLSNIFNCYISLLFVSLSFVANSFSEECSSKASEIESVTASAGNWTNLRNNPGSLRFESERLLNKGYGLLTSADSTAKIAVLLLSSVPTKYLSEYGDRDYCEAKFTMTKANPIKFSDLTFSSINELTSWFGDFSQGSGKEGKEMYAKCDKSCSPQFKIEVTTKDGKISADAFVICGPARDKEDDTYKLKILSGNHC